MTLALSWTDSCFFIVLLSLIFFISRGLKKPHVRQAFESLFNKPIAVSTGIILLFFLSIAVLDSIHFKNDKHANNASVLDQILSPLGSNFEKTYSAPLALYSFSSEFIIKNGRTVQEYPRLKNIAPGIKTLADRNHRIQTVFIHSFLLTFGLALILTGMLYGIKRFTSIGFTVVLTVSLIFFVSYFLYTLSRDLHVFGTGKIGQDILYYAIKSIRTGLIIGLLTTLFTLPFALLLGVMAGYFGGIIDDMIQYIYTTLSSIPGVLLITASILSMQILISTHPEYFPTLADAADARLLALCIILGITSWSDLCRLLRAETLKLREMDYVAAASALGSSSFTIIRKHLIPNVMHIVLITLVLDFSFLILAEAVLSYIGVGVSPLTISWGNMINSARLELARDPLVWWPITAALISMFILVLASNLFADAVRDVFDPRER